jgi:hypothetical protein
LIVVHPPGCTDTHRLDSMPLSELLDSTHDRILDSLWAVGGRWFLPMIEDLA